MNLIIFLPFFILTFVQLKNKLLKKLLMSRDFDTEKCYWISSYFI